MLIGFPQPKRNDVLTKTKLLLPVLLVSLLVGCGEETMAVPALVVEVRDAATGAPAWYEATVVARDGMYADTIGGPLGIPPEEAARAMVLGLAENRPGTYELTVTHPRYETWRRTGIRVGTRGTPNPFDGSPMPNQVHLVVELEPLKTQ